MNTLFCGIKLLESHQIISSKFPIPRNHSTTPKSCKQGQGTITGLSDLEPALGSTSSEPAFKSTSQLSDHQKVKLIRNIHKPFASHLASSSLDSRFESTLSQPESPIYQWTPYFAGSNCRNLIKSYLPNFPFQEINFHHPKVLWARPRYNHGLVRSRASFGINLQYTSFRIHFCHHPSFRVHFRHPLFACGLAACCSHEAWWRQQLLGDIVMVSMYILYSQLFVYLIYSLVPASGTAQTWIRLVKLVHSMTKFRRGINKFH